MSGASTGTIKKTQQFTWTDFQQLLLRGRCLAMAKFARVRKFLRQHGNAILIRILHQLMSMRDREIRRRIGLNERVI